MKTKYLLLAAAVTVLMVCWFSYASAHPGKHQQTKIQSVNTWASFKVPAGVTNWPTATR